MFEQLKNVARLLLEQELRPFRAIAFSRPDLQIWGQPTMSATMDSACCWWSQRSRSPIDSRRRVLTGTDRDSIQISRVAVCGREAQRRSGCRDEFAGGGAPGQLTVHH